MNRVQVHKTLRRSDKIRRHKIRLLLVDDHPSVLNGIRAYLRSRENLRIVGQSLDGADAVQKATALRSDVVILDLSLPKLSGMEVLRRIRSEVPSLKVIAYTMHESREFVREALGAGAVGYVLKSSPLRMLVRAIDRVNDGKRSCDPKIAAAWPLDRSENRGQGKGFGAHFPPWCTNRNLTKRESQILKLVVDGLTNKQIAAQLSVSYNTISNHVTHVYEKLQVNTRGSVVAKAIRENMV